MKFLLLRGVMSNKQAFALWNVGRHRLVVGYRRFRTT